MQHHAADQLHVVGPLAQHPLGGLTDGGEGLVQQVVQRGAGREARLELVGLGPQRLVGQGGELGLQGVDRLRPGPERLDLAVIGRTEKLLGEAEHAKSPEGIGDATSAGNARKPSRIPLNPRAGDLRTGLSPVNAMQGPAAPSTHES